jgi:hypothetical protein
MLSMSGSVEAATIQWQINITPKGCGTVAWHTSSPHVSGILSNSGPLTFNTNAYVDLTFTPRAGYQLGSVTKDAVVFTGLDGSEHAQFGPVKNKHTFNAVFALICPTGSFPLTYPYRLATPIIDVTTNLALGTNSVDIAMDEAGKIMFEATTDRGLVPKGGGPLHGQLGSVTTVKDIPTLQLQSSFIGALNQGTSSVPVTASVAGTVKWNWKPNGTETTTVTAALTTKYKVAKYPTVQQKTNVTGIVSDDEILAQGKAWGMNLTIREATDAKGKSSLLASAKLSKPNGAKTAFAEKTVTYTEKNGYTISFAKGNLCDDAWVPTTNGTTRKAVLDTKSTVTFTKLLFTGAPGAWAITNGTIGYSFLGQIGSGKAADFFDAALPTEEVIASP